ncbi:MAG: hypothetical protein O7C75_06920 [Verrucomicrobia bacterium]|nr:hypothetical protein [Verrucomicrobiota bacterium]
MSGKDFSEVVDLVMKDDSRFGKGAYYFVRKALDFTVKELNESKKERPSHHVSGQELLEGIRKYALDQYGPLTLTVLKDWNIKRCADFGDIVFNLVEFGVLGKTDTDRREDFSGGYDFNDAFLQPFVPNNRRIPNFRANKDKGQMSDGLS